MFAWEDGLFFGSRELIPKQICKHFFFDYSNISHVPAE
jgi:hypothetical protein